LSKISKYAWDIAILQALSTHLNAGQAKTPKACRLINFNVSKLKNKGQVMPVMEKTLNNGLQSISLQQ